MRRIAIRFTSLHWRSSSSEASSVSSGRVDIAMRSEGCPVCLPQQSVKEVWVADDPMASGS